MIHQFAVAQVIWDDITAFDKSNSTISDELEEPEDAEVITLKMVVGAKQKPRSFKDMEIEHHGNPAFQRFQIHLGEFFGTQEAQCSNQMMRYTNLILTV